MITELYGEVFAKSSRRLALPPIRSRPTMTSYSTSLFVPLTLGLFEEQAVFHEEERTMVGLEMPHPSRKSQPVPAERAHLTSYSPPGSWEALPDDASKKQEKPRRFLLLPASFFKSLDTQTFGEQALPRVEEPTIAGFEMPQSSTRS